MPPFFNSYIYKVSLMLLTLSFNNYFFFIFIDDLVVFWCLDCVFNLELTGVIPTLMCLGMKHLSLQMSTIFNQNIPISK